MGFLLRATAAHDTLHFADSELSSLAADGIGPQEKMFQSDSLHFFDAAQFSGCLPRDLPQVPN